MKNRPLLSLVIFFLCTHYTFAQNPFPETPFNKEFAGVRVFADIRTAKAYDSKGNLKEHNGTVLTQFKHSENGLTDTITTYSCLIAETIATYSEDGKLVFRKDDDMFETDFSYDSEGRIQSKYTTIYGYRGIDEKFIDGTETTDFDYVQNTIHFKGYREGKLYKESLTYIQYTDNGYITKTNGVQTEYVFDSQQRLIRNGDIIYDYFENGYTETTKSRKSEYYFLENGYWSKYVEYILKDGNWEHTETVNFTYDDLPDSNQEIKTNSYKVSTRKGGIVIETEAPAQIAIYSINGQLINMKRISAGKEVFNISKGLYIVNIGRESHKIIVK